jgi:uncharacterized protein YodC (DUF2158 family)
MEKIEVGDIVILKGGYSPDMVVEAIVNNDVATCVWFDQNDVVFTFNFKLTSLKLVD